MFLDAGDPALQMRPVPALAAAATSTAATTVTLPATTASGTYYLIAQADAGAAVVEANDTNNARSVLIKIGADLAVSAMTGPTRAAAGGTIVVHRHDGEHRIRPGGRVHDRVLSCPATTRSTPATCA